MIDRADWRQEEEYEGEKRVKHGERNRKGKRMGIGAEDGLWRRNVGNHSYKKKMQTRHMTDRIC